MNGSRLKELRKAKRLRVVDMAQYLDIAPSTYTGYESEYRLPDALTLIKLSNKLDTTVDYLLGLTNNTRQITTNLKELIEKSNEMEWDGIDIMEHKKLLIDFLDLTFRKVQ